MAATPSTREYQVYGRARPRPRSRLRAWAVAAGVVLLAALAIGANAVLVRGEVVRGVSVAGVDVAGSDVRAATATLNEQLAPRLDVPVTVRAGRLRAEVVPSRLGIRLDAGASARRALEMGRVRGSLFPFGYEADVQPVLKLPLDFAAPASLAARTDPPVDARLRLRPDGSSTVVPGRAGIGFEPRGALRAIGLAALAGEAEVQLRQQHLEPRITTADAERAKARVGVILGAPIVLERGDESSGALPRRTVARLLTTRSGRTGIGVVFAPERVREALEPLLRPYLRKPRNATWRTDGERAVVLSSVRGLRLNAKLTAQRLTAASLATEPGKRRARIAFAVSLPAFTTKEARALGITHLVSSFTTDMGVSSPNRIHNVHLMADLLQDQIVGPGETFSFNQAVGPRTAERGFLEGQAIENGLLVPSIGGGVCQVATTVFNAAFEGGYPVGARLNHSFYISHYPMGRDATVADGGPDFSFTNDTRHALLVKTSYTDSTLTVSFYSRPVRRTVTATTSEPTGYTEPRTRYVYDAAVGEGGLTRKTIGQRGFDVTVTRTVKGADGTVLRTDSFRSHYVPEAIVYGVGNGARVPAGVAVENAPPGFRTAQPEKPKKDQTKKDDGDKPGTTTADEPTGTATTPTTTGPAKPTTTN